VLAAFLAALAIVAIGGSLFVFLVKGGTVGILVRGERIAGPIERGSLHLRAVGRASTFSIETFEECARSLFPRYARLGAILMAVYLVSGGGYLAAVLASRNAGDGWWMTALLTSSFVAWTVTVFEMRVSSAGTGAITLMSIRIASPVAMPVPPPRRWASPESATVPLEDPPVGMYPIPEPAISVLFWR